MKKSRLTIMLIVSLAVMMTAVSSMAAVHWSSNGSACRAANLNQAFELGWDHARVYNPGTRDLWVICPIQASVDADVDGSQTSLFPVDDFWRASNLNIYAWFGASSAAAAQVTCVVRDMAAGVTDTAASNFVANDIAATGGALPEVVSGSFDLSTFGLNTLTATCRLPPGTGINAITVTSTKTDGI